MEKLAQTWWKNITGPNNFVSKIVVNLREHKHIVLSNIRSAPWKGELRTLCNSTLSSIYRDVNIEMLDAKDIPPLLSATIY